MKRVLSALGIGAGALLGRGGEASVYALDAERVARVHHLGTRRSAVDDRALLLAELGRSTTRVRFAIPTVLETTELEGHLVSIERRLAGRPLSDVLGESAGEPRAALVRAYLDAAARIGDLELVRPWYGDLCRSDAIRTGTWREYLERRAAHSLAVAGADFGGVVPAELAAALPDPIGAELVHLDCFPGNVLVEGGTVSAVIDFGTVSILGDRRLDPLTAAAYLASSITPPATATDRRIAREWLSDRGLDELFEPAQRWIAAFWSLAGDDPRLYDWCRSTLLAPIRRSEAR